MTREMHFYTLWQKALAALTAAAGKDGAAIFSFHASTKTELLFACALRSLIGTFHKTGLQVKRDVEFMNRNRVVNEGFRKLLGDGWGGFSAVITKPVWAGALSAHGGVLSVCDASQSFNNRLKTLPKRDFLQHRIHKIGDGTVVSVFRIAVMQTMMAGCL